MAERAQVEAMVARATPRAARNVFLSVGIGLAAFSIILLIARV